MRIFFIFYVGIILKKFHFSFYISVCYKKNLTVTFTISSYAVLQLIFWLFRCSENKK